jgi:hypothetical protein
VKIQFSDVEGMQTVPFINLNQNTYMRKHYVYGENSTREPYVLSSELEDNRRVLTVRTKYVLKN